MFPKEVDDQVALLEALIIRLRYEHDSGAVNGTTYVARSLERSAFKLREMLEPSPKKVDDRLERISTSVLCKLIEIESDMRGFGASVEDTAQRSLMAGKALVQALEKE